MNPMFEGESKVQKICDEIRKNTLEPALKEAHEIEAHAKKNAEQILLEAHEKKQKIIDSAEKEIKEKQKIFENALNIAKHRTVENIKQIIEDALFSKHFVQTLQSQTREEEIVAKIISSLLKSVETDGLDDIKVFVPEKSDMQKLAMLLGKKAIEQLQKKMIPLDELTGGAKLKIENKNLVIDLSDEAIADILAKFVRKEFRTILFK